MMPWEVVPRGVFTFNRSGFDTVRRELRVKGLRLDIDGLRSSLLCGLLLAGGRPVTRERLRAKVWSLHGRGGQDIDENTVDRCMSRLRNVLPEEDAAYILAVRGLGWRFDFEREPRVRFEPLGPPAAIPFELRFGVTIRNRQFAFEQLLAQAEGIEVWRVRMPNTPLCRVIMLATSDRGVLALQRELARYRLLEQFHKGPPPYIVRVSESDSSLERAPYFLSLSWEEFGTDLSSYLLGEGRLRHMPPVEQLQLLQNIALAIQSMHDVPMPHGSVGPVSLRVSAHGLRIRLAGLGCRLTAVAGERATGDPRVVAFDSRSLVDYMAPELRSVIERPASLAADLWGFATLSGRILTGNPAWGAGEWVLPEELQEPIGRMGELDPALRGSINQFLADLETRVPQLPRSGLRRRRP